MALDYGGWGAPKRSSIYKRREFNLQSPPNLAGFDPPENTINVIVRLRDIYVRPKKP